MGHRRMTTRDTGCALSLLKSNRKSTRFERLLWVGVGAISLVPLLAVLSESPADFFTDFRAAYCAFFAGVATTGLLLNWGPVVPCSILGVVVLEIFIDPIASSHEEAVFKALGIPLLGATLGAIIGLAIDRKLTHQPIVEADSGGLLD